ncbi:hypothetical protein RIF29_30647 [Crotalaria pallida]|uniref:RING-type domain-containing protein n=1 Tax=Crotalaria pallida TaxID=3830 RepID=A0AAN9EGU1_CROPI
MDTSQAIVPSYSSLEEDNAHSSDPLCLEYYSEGRTDTKAPSLSYQEATNTGQKEIEEQLKNLNEKLEKIRKENITLQSERDQWEMNARHAEDKLNSFRKENEHQLFMLKHEKELISKAEKQARQMVQNLSQKLHCLQIEVETGVAERKKQEEYIHMLQNKCAKTKTELQEQKKCVQRLSVGFDEATQSPLRIFEEKRQKLAYAEVKLDYPERKVTKPDDQVLQTTTLTRYPTYTRQACAICLTNEKDLAFGCGHMSCRDCGSKIRKCHICRKKISNSIKLFHG